MVVMKMTGNDFFFLSYQLFIFAMTLFESKTWARYFGQRVVV
jgi:hypothetical protein